jgi:uncharacterized protein (TIGR03435 family)
VSFLALFPVVVLAIQADAPPLGSEIRSAAMLANQPLKRSFTMLRLVLVHWTFFALMGSLTTVCRAQALAAPTSTFMVATIKPSDPNMAENDGSIGLSPGGSFQAKSQSLKELIEFVQDFGYYDVDQRILGGPKWIASAKFDIEAKCDEQTARVLAFGKIPSKEQVRAEQSMVQALLVDRFKLQTHHEMRRLGVYALVEGKNGLKIKPSEKAGDENLGSAENSSGSWKGDGVTMAQLASGLSALPEVGGRIVIDKTGFKGRFDFTLTWTPDQTMGAKPRGPDSGVKSDSTAPSLLTALQEQLGLKLQMTKAPVDIIVIDSAELPTPN